MFYSSCFEKYGSGAMADIKWYLLSMAYWKLNQQSVFKVQKMSEKKKKSI